MLIINCLFVSSYLKRMFFFSSASNGSVEFINCQFINNNTNGAFVYIELDRFINVEFNNCDFHAIKHNTILAADVEEGNQINVVIRNTNYTTTISSTMTFKYFFSLSYTTLILVDSVNFHNITNFSSIIFLKLNYHFWYSNILT